MNAREVINRSTRLGGLELPGRGSHRRFEAKTPDGNPVYTVVPMHAGRGIGPGLLRAIERQLEPAFGKGWLR